jgi:hypothetical protein
MDTSDMLPVWDEVKTMRVYAADDTAYLCTRKRWVAAIREGTIAFWQPHVWCELLWQTWIATQTTAPRLTRFHTEQVFVTHVTTFFEAEGWTCRREVAHPYGRSDLLMQRNEMQWICEAKLTMGADDVTRALGQLLCAKVVYPHAFLGIITPAPIHARWLAIFASYDITLLEGPWTKQAE